MGHDGGKPPCHSLRPKKLPGCREPSTPASLPVDDRPGSPPSCCRSRLHRGAPGVACPDSRSRHRGPVHPGKLAVQSVPGRSTGPRGREAVHDAPDLPTLAARLEKSIQRYSAQSGDVEERFATGLLAEVPEDAAVLRLLTCGHPPPLLLSGGTVRELEATAASPPFNLSALLGDGDHVDVVPFRAGDSLLLYTDGVSEARNIVRRRRASRRRRDGTDTHGRGTGAGGGVGGGATVSSTVAESLGGCQHSGHCGPEGPSHH
ncbi:MULTISPECIES: PP2C family protein-serine/threonine phosphatase [unclassified Streptomyces]|nr:MULTISPECIES: PP2C family protein-serine/threonine phosphatase [unclassified Streptomyces]